MKGDLVRRPTKHSYSEAGSFDRVREAAHALADAETDEGNDRAFDRADSRLRQACNGYTRRALERLTAWQSKGGRARWAGTTPEQRSEAARAAVRARWEKYEKLRNALSESTHTSKHVDKEQESAVGAK